MGVKVNLLIYLIVSPLYINPSTPPPLKREEQIRHTLYCCPQYLYEYFLITKLNKKEKSAQIIIENIRAGKLQFSILDKESTAANQHPPLSPSRNTKCIF
jgi:hypothetical protein